MDSKAFLETLDDAIDTFELLRRLIPLHNVANPIEKEFIARKMAFELLVDGEKVDFTLKKGLEPFKKKMSEVLSLMGDPLVWLSELYMERENAQ